MNMVQAIEILRQLITTSLMIIGPILGAAMLTGIMISLFQSVTSIQEQTLVFLPKLLAIGSVLIFGAPWFLKLLMQFAITMLSRIPEMTQ